MELKAHDNDKTNNGANERVTEGLFQLPALTIVPHPSRLFGWLPIICSATTIHSTNSLDTPLPSPSYSSISFLLQLTPPSRLYLLRSSSPPHPTAMPIAVLIGQCVAMFAASLAVGSLPLVLKSSLSGACDGDEGEGEAGIRAGNGEGAALLPSRPSRPAAGSSGCRAGIITMLTDSKGALGGACVGYGAARRSGAGDYYSRVRIVCFTGRELGAGGRGVGRWELWTGRVDGCGVAGQARRS